MAEITISNGCDSLPTNVYEHRCANGCDHLSANGCDHLSVNGDDLPSTSGCDSLFDFHAMSYSNQMYPPGLPALPLTANDTSGLPCFHAHATAQPWRPSPAVAPMHSPSACVEDAAWTTTSSILGQLLDRGSETRLSSQSLPSHGLVDIPIPFNEYFVQNPATFGYPTTTPSPPLPPQTDFADLLRFTVTVSSFGPSKQKPSSDVMQVCNIGRLRNEDIYSENVSRSSAASHSLCPNQSSPQHTDTSISEPLNSPRQHKVESVYGTDMSYAPEALPLVQSFRAIESAIATNNKRALKKAVTSLAAVMVNQESSSEASEPVSTSAEQAKDWHESLRLCQANNPSHEANIIRLLAAFQHATSALGGDLDIEDFSTTTQPSSDTQPGDDLANLIRHANQRHHVGHDKGDLVLDTETPVEGTGQVTSEREKEVYELDGVKTYETILASPRGSPLQTSKTHTDDENDPSPLDLCKGNVLTLSLKDQSTCRSLQKHLREASPKVRAAILQEALPHFVRLMTDPIGNYFCQTVLQVCSQDDLRRILDRVWKQLPAMSKSLYGTRAVQKLIERCCPSESKKLLKAFAGHFHDLAIDACGSHVIRQILESIPPEQSDLVHEEIRGNVLEIAMTKRGCCAVQKSLDHCTEQQRTLLIEKIMEHIPQLIQDPFGNYVIQHVLNMEDASINSRILEYVLIDLWYLSKHKFASNVVERCVRLSNPYQLGSIMGSLVSLGVRKVRELLEDSFGNYVIQSVLETVPHDTYGPLDRVVAFCLPDLNQTAHGRRITQILLAKFPFLADTPKLYREGKTRLASDNPTDSSNMPTDDNSVEPHSSTENSRDRSTSSSCSKGHKEKAAHLTSSGGDSSTKKPKSDDPLHGSQTDHSALSFTDGSTPGTRRPNGSLSPEIHDAGQQVGGPCQPPRSSPHSLSVAINRFRNSRRHQGSGGESLLTVPTTASLESVLGSVSPQANSPPCDAWASSRPSMPRSRMHETSRSKPPPALASQSVRPSRHNMSSPRVAPSSSRRNRDD